MIQTWGTWSDFQTLLNVLKCIAAKHNVDISNVSTRWVLDHDEVGAVIVGTRLGLSSNVDSNLKVFEFELDEEDRRRIEEVALGERARRLFETVGDCGQEYQHA